MRPEACCRVGKSIVVCLLGRVESQSESSDHENTVKSICLTVVLSQ